MALDKALLAKLVCPQCKGQLRFDKSHNELTCERDALAFPIRGGVPVMLVSEARPCASKSDPA